MTSLEFDFTDLGEGHFKIETHTFIYFYHYSH
jgi:hypothetical protein